MPGAAPQPAIIPSTSNLGFELQIDGRALDRVQHDRLLATTELNGDYATATPAPPLGCE